MTDIPLFYGQPGRDTIAARLLIVRINDAGAIANWNNDRKLLEFKMCLRDKAVGWFEDLIENRINVDDWDIVKAEFLESYELKYSTKTACANFTDLNQKSDETINDYTYRVQQAYKCVTDKKPADMATVRVSIAAGATEAQIKAEGIADAFLFIKHQLFLAGLKDGLRDKVLEMEKPTYTESVSDSFSFYLGLGSSGGDGNTHGSQGSRLFVRQAFVGLLDAVGVVVDGLVGLLV